ncbi:ClpXP protease specificity-enhancing factor SspB [Amylibacter sp. IMCC11727]|uniref:SspB family protein n=1 Tax=Amylibacter sp. IMCC11727 TaxID=3039851 RepID=UPI00244E2CF2|nr:ClpXP protease specificity-enhancing factor SspB [Amylibacter sp. IMCC11727]WGI20803.1 ClpXP protease specificity-enhancing factor SspB [Amylibacter sp. IMCC11727]
MTKTISYGQRMQHAMRGLMRDLLHDIAKEGELPGEHHFFITFDTNHPGVDIAPWLKERYAQEMTIVIQHWFADLVVLDDRFSITLNFGDQPEPLVIPFLAVKTFVDPSVDFGLPFNIEDDLDADIEEIPESPMVELDGDEGDVDEPPKGDAEVVSLDAFRKT